MSAELLGRARAGDREAFAALVEPHRGELQVHCYRMLGSLQDAEDAVQEALLSAWLGLDGFEGRSSVRTWLYRIATNRCLNVLRSAGRRPVTAAPLPIQAPEPTRMGEVLWLQPYPDVLLDGLPDQAPGPEARYESREAISLAFVTAVQLLPPNQRAVLLLRDVLDYSVRETTVALGLSEPSVKTTHHRARQAMSAYDRTRRPPTAELRAETRAALERFLGALVGEDTAAAEACLAEGARLVSDGGGEFRAALRPVLGRDRVARFFFGLQRKLAAAMRFEVRTVNGLPAVVAAYEAPREGWGPRFVMRVDTDVSGAIRDVHVIVATAKLTQVAAV